MVTIYHLSDSDRCQDRHGRSFRRRGIIASYSEYKWQGSPGAQQQLEYLRACPLGRISPGPHPRARSDGRDIIPSGRGINIKTFDVGDGNVPAAWPPGRSGRNKGICSFFARSARHVLVEERTRSYLTLPTILHSLLNVSSLQQHFLDDQRKFATFIYIRPSP